MASDQKTAESHSIENGAALAGILALLVDARERALTDDKSAAKTELVLSNAGMTIDDISAVTGKKYDAVRMAIRRGKVK